MQLASSSRLRLSALTFGVAAIVFFLGLTHPDPTPATAIATVSSSGWIWGHVALIVSHVLLPLGLFGIWAVLASGRSQRAALVAFILSILGSGWSLPGFGVLAIALPIVGANQSADLIQALLGTPLLGVFLGVGSLFVAAGAIVFAIAIGRAGKLSRAAAVVYAVGWVLLIPEPVIGQLGRVLVGAIILFGGIWLAVSLWKQA